MQRASLHFLCLLCAFFYLQPVHYNNNIVMRVGTARREAQVRRVQILSVLTVIRSGTCTHNNNIIFIAMLLIGFSFPFTSSRYKAELSGTYWLLRIRVFGACVRRTVRGCISRHDDHEVSNQEKLYILF